MPDPFSLSSLSSLVADANTPDEVRFGAVVVAATLLNEHITDPVARKAWTIVFDAVIHPWLLNVAEKNQ